MNKELIGDDNGGVGPEVLLGVEGVDRIESGIINPAFKSCGVLDFLCCRRSFLERPGDITGDTYFGFIALCEMVWKHARHLTSCNIQPPPCSL